MYNPDGKKTKCANKKRIETKYLLQVRVGIVQIHPCHEGQ